MDRSFGYPKNGPGWSVTGITVLAADNKGKYKNLIEVIDHHSDKAAKHLASDQNSTPKHHPLCTSPPSQLKTDAAITSCEGRLKAPSAVTSGFRVCYDLAVEQCFRFGERAGGATQVPLAQCFSRTASWFQRSARHGARAVLVSVPGTV